MAKKSAVFVHFKSIGKMCNYLPFHASLDKVVHIEKRISVLLLLLSA